MSKSKLSELDWKSLHDVERHLYKNGLSYSYQNGCSMVKKLISLVIFQLKVQ